MAENLAWYRQWRPGLFREVVGQEHITRILKNALKTRAISHAYLFCGPRGTGKTSVARILSKAVNCPNAEDAEPCNRCPSCQSISEGSASDVIEIDGASNRGIGEIRDLREKVKYLPLSLSYKVYIIDEIHMLTQEAFNALLKTLEEPPEHCIFILATTEPYRIPQTVMSRCQRLDFRRLSISQITPRLSEVLTRNSLTSDYSLLEVIARAADGSLRDAISLLEQCIVYGDGCLTTEVIQAVLGTIKPEDILELCTSIIGKEISDVFVAVDRIINQGYDPRQLLLDIETVFRDVVALKVGDKVADLVPTSAAPLDGLGTLADTVSISEALRLLDRLFDSEPMIRYSPRPRLTLELILLTLCGAGEEHGAPNGATPRKLDGRESQGAREVAGHGDASERGIYPEISSNENQELKKSWEHVLESLKKGKRMKVYAFLSEGEPVKMVDGVIYIRYKRQFQFHVEQVNAAENKKQVEEVLSKVFGKPVTFQTILAKKESEGSVLESPGVKGAIELFGGQIIKVEKD